MYGARHTCPCSCQVLLPAFGIHPTSPGDAPKYIVFGDGERRISMGRSAARVYHLRGVGGSIRYYIKYTVVPEAVRVYNYDQILSKEDKGKPIRELNRPGDGTLEEFGISNVFAVTDGIIKPIAPNTPLYLLPRSKSDMSIVEIFGNKSTTVRLYDLQDKNKQVEVKIDPVGTTLGDLAERFKYENYGVEFISEKEEKRLPYWMLVPSSRVSYRSIKRRTHIEFRDCFGDVIFLPSSPGKRIQDYIDEFCASRGGNRGERCIIDSEQNLVTDPGLLCPDALKYYYVLNSVDDFKEFDDFKDSKHPHTFAPHELEFPALAELEDTLQFISCSVYNGNGIDVKIESTDPQSYVTRLNLGDLSDKVVVFKSSRYGQVITDLVARNLNVYYQVVDNWIEFERIYEDKEKGARSPSYVLSPVKPGMTFLDCEEMLRKMMAPDVLEGNMGITFHRPYTVMPLGYYDFKSHEVLRPEYFGKKYCYRITPCMVLFDLDDNLKSYEITLDYLTRKLYISSLVFHKNIERQPKDGYVFLFYEDKDRQVRMADAPLTVPPKGAIYFEQVVPSVNFIVMPSDGSKNFIIRIPLDNRSLFADIWPS